MARRRYKPSTSNIKVKDLTATPARALSLMKLHPFLPVMYNSSRYFLLLASEHVFIKQILSHRMTNISVIETEAINMQQQIYSMF
jgi:hypothetical protein